MTRNRTLLLLIISCGIIVLVCCLSCWQPMFSKQPSTLHDLASEYHTEHLTVDDINPGDCLLVCTDNGNIEVYQVLGFVAVYEALKTGRQYVAIPPFAKRNGFGELAGNDSRRTRFSSEFVPELQMMGVIKSAPGGIERELASIHFSLSSARKHQLSSRQSVSIFQTAIVRHRPR